MTAKKEAPKKEAPKKGVYVGEKSLTSKVGILKPGAPVTADKFTGGKETLDLLIERGHCVKVD